MLLERDPLLEHQFSYNCRNESDQVGCKSTEGRQRRWCLPSREQEKLNPCASSEFGRERPFSKSLGIFEIFRRNTRLWLGGGRGSRHRLEPDHKSRPPRVSLTS